MCFKYEKDYECCFDYMEFGDQAENLNVFLSKEYNIKITDNSKFYTKLFKFFEEVHEEETMVPEIHDAANSCAICDKCGSWIRLNTKIKNK